MAIDWTYNNVLASNGYASSCVIADFLLVAYSIQRRTYFKLVWIETGKEYDFTDVQHGSIEEVGQTVKILSMEASGEFGVYALAKYTNTLNEVSYRVLLLGPVIGSSIIQLRKLGYRDLPGNAITKYTVEAKESLEKYPPHKVYLYHLNTDTDKQIPGILLAGNIKSETEGTTGLILYGFGIVDSTTNDYKDYSYNPFARKVTDSSRVEISTSLGQYLKCPGETYSLFNCLSSSTICPTKFYKKASGACTSCHYTCNTCTGPLSNQCITCEDGSSFISQLEQCFTHGSYNGYWLPGVTATSPAYKFGAIRDSCPHYTFNLLTDFDGVFLRSDASAEQSFYKLETGCPYLPGPIEITEMPNEFTIGLWVNILVDPGDIIVWAFKNLQLLASSSGISIKLSSVTHSIAIDWSYREWKYIAVSVKTSVLGYTITPFTARYCTNYCPGNQKQTIINTYTSSSPIPLIFSSYTNAIYVGCTPTSSTSINTGYIRDLSFIPKYLNSIEINSLKSITYKTNLQINELIYYWRFYPLTNDISITDNSGKLISDIRTSSTNVALDASAWTDLKTAKKYESTLGILGTCFDLFSYSKFPAFSFDTLNFAGNELQPKINLNSFVLLGAIIRTGDEIKFTHGGCNTNHKLLSSATVTLQVTGKVILTQTQRIPMEARGTFIDSCYCSSSCIWLGRTYFPQLPTQIYPAHKMSESSSSTALQFELRGGDQSYGDKLTLVNIERDMETAIGETIIVNEADIGYQTYSVIKQSTGVYNKLTITNFDPGIYTIAWRPSYMSYLINEQNVIYKNLYTTWTIQSFPKVKFPPIPNVIGMYKFTVEYKSEFFNLDLIGNGQADGDQVIFCHVSCNFRNIQGGPEHTPIFQRENGRYPPIWFGDTAGVSKIKSDDPASLTLYICWRPAARANHIPPEDDQWNSLENLQRPGNKAYVLVKSALTNADKNEIDTLSLSLNYNKVITAPLLLQGEAIWFTITDGNPLANGIIEIAHVVYNDYESYNLETIWKEVLVVPTDSSGIYTSGKVKGENGKYILYDVPHSEMKPGHDYMLIIYSKTFNKLGSITDLSPQPQFKYLFRYQESTFNTPIFTKFTPTTISVTITGTNFGTLIIPGNEFEEVRELFGVAASITTTPTCGNEIISASYIPGTMKDTLNKILLKDIDLTSCNSVDTLTVNLKLLKITDGYTKSPIWSTTSHSLLIGAVGCDSSCASCSSSECLTCRSSKYLYKGRCLSKCGNDLPYVNLVFKVDGSIDYYKCTSECSAGYYLDKGLGFCMKCNVQCGTCSSGETMSCISCKGIYEVDTNSIHNYMNFYKESYYFKGMCLQKCPSIINPLTGIAASDKDVMKANNYNHICETIGSLVNSKDFDVKIQPIIYSERVNAKRPIKVRALIEDLRTKINIPLSPQYIWTSHLPEDFTDPKLSTSDSRIFQDYTNENIETSITTLNMNAFNYKNDKDPIRLIVQSWDDTAKLFNFDMIELLGNLPPEINNMKLVIADGVRLNEIIIDNFDTMHHINITLSNVKDADDYYPILKFKVLLAPNSLVLPNPLPEAAVTPEPALEQLAQLPKHVLTLYSSKEVTVNSDGSVNLNMIYIPPLFDGLQIISRSDKVNSSEATCDLYVYVEDRYKGVSKLKSVYTIKESYFPTMNKIIVELLKNTTKRVNNQALDWDDVLRISHIFRAINPIHSLYYMSYTQCSRDDQCNNGGKCVTSAGYSKCACKSGYTGITCSWELENLINQQKLVNITVNYFNTTILTPARALSSFSFVDINVIDQVANFLTGILKNPEVVEKKYMDCILDMTWYMTRLDYLVGGRMEDFERNNVFVALDAVIKYIYFQLREEVYEYYVFGEEKENFSNVQKVEYKRMRDRLVEIVSRVRSFLYTFVDSSSLIQYPADVPFSMKYDTFEVLIASTTEEKLFTVLGDNLGIQLDSSDEFIRIPSNILKTLRREVSYNEEFKFRLIKWKENPYIFSDYHSEICSSVYNFAILDGNSKVITTEFSEPVVIFMPISNFVKNLPNDVMRCKYYDEKHMTEVIVETREKINVNTLPLTNKEKSLLYPEWNAEFYHSKDLILEQVKYEVKMIDYPEFDDIKGINAYGNILKSTEYLNLIPCAMYSSGEVAAIVERGLSHKRDFQTPDFYHTYDPLNIIYMSVGACVCVIVGILFLLSTLAAVVADKLLLPRHVQLIMQHRPEYLEENSNDANDVSIISNSNSKEVNELSDKSEENVKEIVKVSGRCAKDKNKTQDGRKLSRRLKHKKAVNNSVGETSDMYEDKLNTNGNQSEPKSESKGSAEDNVQSQTAQNLMASVVELSNTDPQILCSEESNLKSLFFNTEGERTIKNTKETSKCEDIFSKKYLEKREIEEFSFINVYMAANPMINVIIRSNTIFTRPARIFTFYSYIYLLMFWSCLFISVTSDKLSHPNDIKITIFWQKVWVMLLSPALSSCLVFLVAAIFKMDESKTRKANTAHQYKKLM